MARAISKAEQTSLVRADFHKAEQSKLQQWVLQQILAAAISTRPAFFGSRRSSSLRPG
jgi:hypothetical protein